MRFVSAEDFPKQRIPSLNIDHLHQGKSREVYLRVAKNLGIDDVCECNIVGTIFNVKPPTKIRENSGKIGQDECTLCGMLRHPLWYIYDCDECCEPTLSPIHPIPKGQAFYCQYCTKLKST